MNCKNHPDKAATRRCFTCKDPICAACSLHRDKHYFCSENCHAGWVALPAPKRKVPRKRKKREAGLAASLPPPVPPAPAVQAAAPPPRPELVIHQTPEPPAAPFWIKLAVAANAAGLVIVCLFLALGRLGTPAPGLDDGAFRNDLRELVRAAMEPPAPPSIDVFPTDTTASTLLVEGSASPGVPVEVWFNGRRIEPVRRTGDRFRAGPLPLEFGLNVLQAASSPSTGETHYSLARIVRRLDVPPPVEQRPLKIELTPGRRSDITRGNPAHNAVSFTFDGGSEGNAAGAILDTLANRGIHTTLFLTGQFIRRNPDLVRRAVHEGHEIGNHTWSHPHLTTYELNQRHDLREGVGKEMFQRQLREAADELRRVAGVEMAPFWRAPYGEVNAALSEWAEELGFRHVGWTLHVGATASLDSLDWVEDTDSKLYVTGSQLRDRYEKLVESDAAAVRGGIFLMHLGTDRKKDMIHQQLGAILDAYLRNGFQILPVSQLIR